MGRPPAPPDASPQTGQGDGGNGGSASLKTTELRDSVTSQTIHRAIVPGPNTEASRRVLSAPEERVRAPQVPARSPHQDVLAGGGGGAAPLQAGRSPRAGSHAPEQCGDPHMRGTPGRMPQSPKSYHCAQCQDLQAFLSVKSPPRRHSEGGHCCVCQSSFQAQTALHQRSLQKGRPAGAAGAPSPTAADPPRGQPRVCSESQSPTPLPPEHAPEACPRVSSTRGAPSM